MRDILLPGTVPAVLGGVRIALAGAWGLEAIAELLGAQEGIGKVVEVLAGATDVEGIFAALLLLGLVAVACDALAAYGFAPARRLEPAGAGGWGIWRTRRRHRMIALERVSRTFRRAGRAGGARRQRRVARCPGGPVRLHGGPVRLRQEHPAPDGGRACCCRRTARSAPPGRL